MKREEVYLTKKFNEFLKQQTDLEQVNYKGSRAVVCDTLTLTAASGKLVVLFWSKETLITKQEWDLVPRFDMGDTLNIKGINAIRLLEVTSPVEEE